MYSIADHLIADGVPRETVKAFFAQHKEHPQVWSLFERFALDAAEAKVKLGAKAIMERIRWEVEVERKGQFKVSNSWTAYYARVFAIKHPKHRHYFDFKQVKGVSV